MQTDVVLDARALGRDDARFLVLLRRLVMHLKVETTRQSIWVLSHATSHLVIFWTSENWIRASTRKITQASFRWSVEEILHFFAEIELDEIGRGTLSQSLYMLLLQDPSLNNKLSEVVRLLLLRSETERAVMAVWIALSSVDDPWTAQEFTTHLSLTPRPVQRPRD